MGRINLIGYDEKEMCKNNYINYILFAVITAGSAFLYLQSFTSTLLVHHVALSFYGLFILSYFGGQMVFTLMNRRRVNARDIVHRYAPTCLLIVGYREDPEYWSYCVQSAVGQKYPLGLILICIDGNEEEDREMARVASEILLDTATMPWKIHLCNHGGKRSAMAAGFELLREHFAHIENVVMCDSDTRLDPEAVYELVRCIGQTEDVGCATGTLRIFDTHLMGRIVNARYAYAFDIERASMSYFGVMNCCSGPLSIYRCATVTTPEFIQEFLSQKCGGKECGPGDDRHLTAMILNRGYKSLQTHLSIGHTEAPAGILRFLKQQLRWIRSFYREMPYQIRAMGVQHWTLAFITHYEIMYPYFLIGWVVWAIAFHPISITHAIRSVVIAIIMITIRTVFSIVVHGFDPVLAWGVIYLPLYFLFILPMKPLALITCNVMGWATTARLYGKHITHLDIDALLIVMSIVAWNGCLVAIPVVRYLYS